MGNRYRSSVNGVWGLGKKLCNTMSTHSSSCYFALPCSDQTSLQEPCERPVLDSHAVFVLLDPPLSKYERSIPMCWIQDTYIFKSILRLHEQDRTLISNYIGDRIHRIRYRRFTSTKPWLKIIYKSSSEMNFAKSQPIIEQSLKICLYRSCTITRHKGPLKS